MPVPEEAAIVDSHHHVWDLSVRAQPFLESSEELAPLRRTFLLPDLEPLAAAAGVSGTVAVQTVTEPGETTELLALARAGTLVAAVVGWVDLTEPAVADSLAALRGQPGGDHLAGIRHPLLTEPDPGWIARHDVRRGLAAVAAGGLAFDLVLQPELLPAAVDAAAAIPELTFVLDHLANVRVEPRIDPGWEAAFTRFAALPNTVCKLSGILGDPGSATGPEIDVAHLRPYFDLALSCFGPGRLMFGSDWPVCTLTASYAEVVARARALIAQLSDSEQREVLGGTASRVYQIDH